jgi:hypothetical protein
MAKNSVRDYSATNSSNTDIQSIDISEGCSPAGINNAVREIMVDLKNVSTGAVALETPSADQLNVDNLRLDGNTISSTDTNGNVTIDPDGTGKVAFVSDITMTSDDPTITMTDSSGTNDIATIQATSGALIVTARDGSADGEIIFKKTDGSTTDETMRIDSSGSLLVGQSSTTVPGAGNTTAGTSIRGTDGVFISRTTSDTSASALQVNKTTGAGAIINVASGGTTVGTIGANGGYIYAGSGNTNLRYHDGVPAILPASSGGSSRDNAIDLGTSNARFDDIFATNGTIQTSDQNEKQHIASLTDAEITAAKAISALFKTFKWNDKVEAKGNDARTHTGVIAQEVQTAMTDAGLDAADYAFWCSDTWWETSTEVPAVEADEEAGIEAQDAYTRIDTYQTADEAPDGATQRTRMGIRYPELLAFIGAATEQRLASIESRLTALEAE